MKSLTLLCFTILALMTIGCEDSPAQNQKYGNHQVYEAAPAKSQNKNNDDDKITMLTVMNPKTGQPSMYIPYPSSWKFIKAEAIGQPVIKGPNGLTCTIYPPQSYMYTNNTMMNQSYQSSGIQVMAPVGIENVLNQLILPQGQQMGMTLLNQYSLPGVAAKDREYPEKLAGRRLPESIYEAVGTEWKDGQGNKVLVILHYFEMRSNTSVSWGYNTEMMKVQESNFEHAKKQYVYAMANKIFNKNDVIIFQRNLAAQTKIQEDHAGKMRQIIAKGSADRLADNKATNEHIANVNREIYENKAHNNDLLQQQENNALTDVNVVVSPFDGKEYQVESGNKTYWINDEGQYIKSDDPLYDPNKYENSYDVWKKAPAKEYK